MTDAARLEARAAHYLAEQQRSIHVQADRLFAVLMGVQVFGCIVVALFVSPHTWIGSIPKTHVHVYASIVLGAVIASLPVTLAIVRPGEPLTRHIIAAGQMLMSALLIHVSGGRIETHFHIFGSLAFLAFYRDWRVLITATVVVSIDHFLRGVFWPESVFGVLAASRWRWLEHVAWVLFADLFLVRMCVLNVRQMRGLAQRQAELEETRDSIEAQIVERTRQLNESEERYRSFASNIPGIAYRAEWGGDQGVLLAEGISEPICGIPIDRFKGVGGVEEMFKIVHEDDRDLLATTLTSTIETKQPKTIEYRVHHTDGSVRWVSDSMRPVYDDAGAFLYHDGIVLDVTERRRAEERLDLAIRAANEGLWDWNLVTDEIFFNETTFSMLGYECGDVPATLDGWKSILHAEDLSRALSMTQDHLEGKTPNYRCEVRAKAKDGSWRWLLDVGEVAERDRSGRPTRMIGVHIDITELREARERAEAADRAKSDFLSNMSHELRTPLNGVLGYAQLLLRDESMSQAQRRSMAAIQSCGQHLLTLINDVLDLAKIESGKLNIEPEDVDLQRLLVSVRDVLAQRATEKNIALSLDVAPEVPRGVATDPTKLRQVLVNLAGNAIKFTDEGSVAIRVSEPTLGSFRFEVEDTGVGMTDAELARAFDAFAQAEAGKHAGGTGLGLAISRRIVEALGGELTATSQPGVGSRFAFELPMREIELAQQTSSSAGLDDRTTLVVPDGQCLRVLVADDRPENRDILKQMLRFPRVEVATVENGQAAVEHLRASPVDVVLMDVRMPVMNGIEATRAIRRDTAISKVKIIAISASVFENQRKQIRSAGCDDFLGKPLQATELYRSLATLCGLELGGGAAHEEDAPEQMIRLDAALSQKHGARLAELTAVGDVTAIEQMSIDLRGATEPEQLLAARIEELLSSFDLTALRSLADKLLETEEP